MGHRSTHWRAHTTEAAQRAAPLVNATPVSTTPLYRKRRTNAKYWPEERWSKVIRAIHAHDPSKHIVLMGTPGEHALNEKLRVRARVPRVHNVACDLPIDVFMPQPI
jgi:ADP-heptose:LPS heptosyltransferase